MNPAAPTLPASPEHILWSVVFWGLDVAVAVGLWYFSRWARILFIAQFLAMLIACVFHPGPVVQLTQFLPISILQYFLDGAIITAAFLQPVSALFAKRAGEPALSRTI
jgi:hypothetical protein